MKSFLCVWQYLAGFYLKGEMFRIKVVDEIRTHILFSITFYQQSCRFWDNVEKYGGAGRPQTAYSQYGVCALNAG
jgi:hypothetical protein